MEYVRFGSTDLKVSPICQGTAFRHLPRADDPRSLQVLEGCLEAGINFFDSSNAYGWGRAETVLGKALAGRRQQVVICTKIAASLAPKSEDEPGERARFTPDFIETQLEGSLKRLQTDWVDLYLLHQPDGHTPAEDIVPAMEKLVEAGKIRYWGLSNHSAQLLGSYLDIGAPVAGVEEYYNIAGGYSLDETGRSRVGRLEEEVFPLVEAAGLGLIAFSPMDTGQLAPQRSVEAGSPLEGLCRVLDQVAAQLEVSRGAVCTAWVLSRPAVSAVLSGAESLAHVEDNLVGAGLALPDAAREILDRASAAYRQQVEAA